MKFTIEILPFVDSTQTHLESLLTTKNLEEGTLILATDQWQGHGQEGNSWESEAGKNLTFSLLLKPIGIKAADQFYLNMAMSLGVTDYLMEKKNISSPVFIKWPNDFYIGRKKVGGMIMNNAVSGDSLLHCIIGIGLNINQFDFTKHCPNPTSLTLETRIEYDLNTELNTLLKSLTDRYQALLDHGLMSIRKDYLARLFQIGIEAAYRIKGVLVYGMIQGVDEFGRLQFTQNNNTSHCCDIREIEFVL
ncbi:MAG: biotin--[acetyl-CoA-carboxylase] ligase [Bacteroidota bacterium]